MPKELYMLDSINAKKIYDNFTGPLDLNYYHSFNCYFAFTAIKNVKRITLKSVEMPLTLLTVRFQNSSTNIKFIFSYGAFNNISISVNLSPTTYTTIASLLTDINTQITAALTTYSGVSIVFSSVSSNIVNLCSITYNCISFTLLDTPLSNYILGFTNKYTSIESPLQSTAPINLYGIDNIIYITFPNIPNNNINSKYLGFKLPIINIINNTLYYSDSTEHQSIILNDSNFTLDKLNILVLDRLGRQLTGFYNFTMSLIIEYENETTQEEFLNFNN
jgi:hypothetical protein